MSDKKKDSPEDENEDTSLFRRAVAGTRRVQADFVELPRKRPAPRARFRRADERAALRESLDINVDDLEASAAQRLRYRRPELSERALRRLARGHYAVQAEIDLHGLTADQAEAELREFFDDCVQRGLRCVRVIHGKGLRSGLGGPVLKVRVNRWLRRWREVLAFVSARQPDGGAGAVYVLLRRS